MDQNDDAETKELIRHAFAMAESSGRENWREMTLPVLKNRMLVLSDRRFDEKKLGVTSFRELVRRYRGDFLELDETTKPPIVRLRPKSEKARAQLRIRPDLWRAILDYSSGHKYVWDAEKGVAVVADPSDQRPQVPTITQALLDDWRAAFVQRQWPLAAQAEQPQLEKWREQALPTAFLPGGFKGQWNEELKRRVTERLSDWFSEQHIAMPASETSPAVPTPGAVSGQGATTSGLRLFILDCIGRMSEEELKQVSLPASSVRRILHQR